MQDKRPVIVLFRQDLRLEDNPALWHASKSGLPLVLVYILDDEIPGKWKMGQAQRWWLHHSLTQLQEHIAKAGGNLILRRGNTLHVITELVQACKARGVYFNRCYEPFWIKTEQALRKNLGSVDVEVNSFNGSLLIEPWELLTKQGTPYKVFTRFWEVAVKGMTISEIYGKPALNSYQDKKLDSDELGKWNLLPHIDWAKEFSTMWSPGEMGAHEKCHRFLDNGVLQYVQKRDEPAIEGTSRLSPHLHFGEIGPRQVYRKMMNRFKDFSSEGVETFFKELGWREFCYYLLYHFPQLPEEPFQSKFSKFPWKETGPTSKAWQTGYTGYPIVDAGMRQLWRTGWMHNRVRIIVASFLTKDLLIPWQEGERWFWDTLVDADLANNAAGWQWVAGCGADAAPYFRIFSPVLQGEKFDPEGDYIRQWIPEFAKVPNKYIHKPWEAPPILLEAAGVRLGKTYPYPVVDHAEARKVALSYFEKLIG
jgi:deoxyribodipyrimidine photo-lyase